MRQFKSTAPQRHALKALLRSPDFPLSRRVIAIIRDLLDDFEELCKDVELAEAIGTVEAEVRQLARIADQQKERAERAAIYMLAEKEQAQKSAQNCAECGFPMDCPDGHGECEGATP